MSQIEGKDFLTHCLALAGSSDALFSDGLLGVHHGGVVADAAGLRNASKARAAMRGPARRWRHHARGVCEMFLTAEIRRRHCRRCDRVVT